MPAEALTMEALARLRPYVRIAGEEWRGPWRIARRRICDYLIVAIVEGRGRFALDDRPFDVAAGDIVWLPPAAPHAMEGFAPRMKVLFAHVDLRWDPRASPTRPITRGGEDDLAALRGKLHAPIDVEPVRSWRGKLAVVNAGVVRDELRRIVAEERGGRDPALQAGAVLRLLGHLARGLAPCAVAARAHWQAMQRAAEQLRAGPELAHGARALAARAGLSPAQFRRRFVEVHGESPRRLLARARVEKARDLLLYGGDRRAIGAIATEVGFASVHGLSRAFRRAFGVSPQAMRRAGGG